MKGYIKQLSTLLSIKSTCSLADCAFKIFDMFSGDLILSILLNFTWYIRLITTYMYSERLTCAILSEKYIILLVFKFYSILHSILIQWYNQPPLISSLLFFSPYKIFLTKPKQSIQHPFPRTCHIASPLKFFPMMFWSICFWQISGTLNQ